MYLNHRRRLAIPGRFMIMNDLVRLAVPDHSRSWRSRTRGGLMDLSRVQAVLLDMDGTLVDSDAAVEASWRQWAARDPVAPRPRAGDRTRVARAGQRAPTPAGPVRGRGRGRGPVPAGAGVRRRRRHRRGPGRARAARGAGT